MAFDPYAASNAAAKKYYEDKNKGKYGTTSNSTVQQQAAVKAAQQAASTGNYGTTSGGTVKGTARPKAYTSGGGGVSQSERAAAYSTHSTPKVTVPTITAPTITAPKKKRNTGAAPKYDAAAAVKAAVESAAKQQQSGKLLMRDNYTVNYSPYLDDEDETGTTDVTSDVAGSYTMQSGRYQLPEELNRYNEGTVMKLLNRYGVTPEQVGMPLEYLYYGGSKYMGAPHLLKYSNNHVIQDHNGNRITVGDLRYALENGLYMIGNENAYNNWVQGVAQNEVNTVDPYEYEEDYGDFGAYDDYEDDQQSAFADYIRAAIEAITGQKAGIDESAAAAKQQAYANYMRSRLGMGESTAGMATGTADSLAVQNDLMLQNSLNAIDRDRLNAYADVDSQAAQMEAEGNLQLAQMAAEAQQRAEERAMQEREWAYQLEQDRIKNAGGGGSSGGSYTPKPTLTAAQAKEAYQQGMRTQQVLEAMQYYYGLTPEQIVARDNVTGGIGGTYVPKTTVTTTPAQNLANGQMLLDLLRTPTK